VREDFVTMSELSPLLLDRFSHSLSARFTVSITPQSEAECRPQSAFAALHSTLASCSVLLVHDGGDDDDDDSGCDGRYPVV
jgi:hypothetical protein